jgi:RNA-binding protein
MWSFVGCFTLSRSARRRSSVTPVFSVPLCSLFISCLAESYNPRMPNKLSSARRSELRAEAHKLSPVVQIGDKGLTDEVVAEIDRSLKAHELIKVRAMTDERDARNVWLESICEKLDAHPVQQIGKVFVIYRENPKEAPLKRPAPRPTTKREARDGKPGDAKRTSRPRSRTPSPRPESEPRRRRPKTSR